LLRQCEPERRFISADHKTPMARSSARTVCLRLFPIIAIGDNSVGQCNVPANDDERDCRRSGKLAQLALKLMAK